MFIYIKFLFPTYTECLILISQSKYLKRCNRYEKMFRTKVVCYRGG